MSNFYKHAEALDEKAKAAFSKYQQAEKLLKEAQAAANAYPERHGMVSLDYTTKHLAARAALAAAEQEHNKALNKLKACNDEFEAMREKLAQEVAETYRAKPEHIDHDMLELLKSGVMKSADYTAMLQKAQRRNNAAMVRIIGKYADEAAEIRRKQMGYSDDATLELQTVAEAAKGFDGSEHLNSFDILRSIYSRCANNPGMIGHWDELTHAIVENF